MNQIVWKVVLCLGLASILGLGTPREASARRFAVGVSILSATPTTGRWAHQAVLLNDGRVLSAGGFVAGLFTGKTKSAELFNPATGTWTPTGDMRVARANFALVKLPDGNVLAVGGGPAPRDAASDVRAEIYDASTGLWSPTANMPDERESPTATLMINGKVLLVGGSDLAYPWGINPVSWRYDPPTRSWAIDASLIRPRNFHTGSLLPDGTVLIVGGEYLVPSVGTATLDFSERFTGGTFIDAGPLTYSRTRHTATTLSDGRVLVVGGAYLSGTTYYPVLATEMRAPGGGWSTAASPAQARTMGHTATRLPDGRVAVIDGSSGAGNSAPSTSIEIFEPATGSWTSSAYTNFARSFHTATLLLDGSVLIDGGNPMATIPSEIFFP